MMFFYCLGPAAYDLDYHCESLHPKRWNISYNDKTQAVQRGFWIITILKYVNQQCQNSFNMDIFLCFQLRNWILGHLKKYYRVHACRFFSAISNNKSKIHNATEIAIQKPSNICMLHVHGHIINIKTLVRLW